MKEPTDQVRGEPDQGPDGETSGSAVADAIPPVDELARQMLVEPAVGAVGEPPVTQPTLRYQILTLSEWAESFIASWIVEGILPDGGLGIIYGKPGGGKTLVAVDLLADIVQGGRFAGKFLVHRSGPVVFATGEGLTTIKPRFDAACKARGLDEATIERFGLLPEVPHLTEPGAADSFCDAIEAHAAEHWDGQKPLVVALDTLTLAMTGSNENEVEDVGKLLASIETIRRRIGAAVQLVHHCNKGGQLRGSTAIEAAADVVAVVVPTGGPYGTMKCEKAKATERFEDVPFTIVSGGDGFVENEVRIEWHRSGESRACKSGGLDAVLGIIQERAQSSDDALNLADIAEALFGEGSVPTGWTSGTSTALSRHNSQRPELKIEKRHPKESSASRRKQRTNHYWWSEQ